MGLRCQLSLIASYCLVLMIPAACATPSANNNGKLSVEHNKTVKDANNNTELDNKLFVSESNRLSETKKLAAPTIRELLQ